MRKRERLAGSKAYRLRFEAEKSKPLFKLRHTESAADALSDLLANAVLPADETEEEENVGVQAVRTGRQGAESSVRRMSKQRQKKQIQRQYAAAPVSYTHLVELMMFSAKKRKTEEWPQVSQTGNLALSRN